MQKLPDRLSLLLTELERMRTHPPRENDHQFLPATPREPIAPPVVVQTVCADADLFRMRREVGPLLRRPWSAAGHQGEGAAAIIYVTSAVEGEGVSTVARELVHAAAAMPFCRPLLIDCARGQQDQSSSFGEVLPSLTDSYINRGCIEVASVEALGASFHAAAFEALAFHPPGLGADPGLDDAPVASRTMAGLYRALRTSYNFIVLDCPPVLEAPYFIPVTPDTPEVLLVVRAERTRIPTVMRAKDEIGLAGGRLAGVVMNQRRSILPRFIDRFL